MKTLVIAGSIGALVFASHATPPFGVRSAIAAAAESPAFGPNIDLQDWGSRFLAMARAGRAAAKARGQALDVGGTDVELEGWNETTFAVDPGNPLHVACASLFELRVSTDGGATWQTAVAPSIPLEFGVMGDPSVAFDSQGRLFWSYLASPAGSYFAPVGSDVFIAQCDPATGAVLPGYPVNVTTGIGLPATSGIGHDMEWLAVDAHPASPFADRLYLTWTEFPPSAPERTLFTWSSDHGLTWSPALTLGTVVDTAFVWPVHVAVGPGGDVFVSEHRQAHFAGSAPDGVSGFVNLYRSTDGGVSFPQQSQPFAAGQADATFNVQISAAPIPGATFWLQGGAQAWVLPDPTIAGRVYVVASDDPDNAPAAGDAGNVMLARSSDSGVTWDPPVRVDSGPGTTLQAMPTATIDAATGVIAVQYYDNRSGAVNGQGRWLLDVYAAVSRDHGGSFLPDFKVSDRSFDPDAGARCRFSCGQLITDVWAGTGGAAFAVAANGNFLKYDGATWTTVSTTAVTKFGIWGGSNSQVFTVGNGGEIRRYNGNTVQSQNSPTAQSLYAIDGRNGSDVFAVGAGGVIAHYNGASWGLETSPTTQDLHQVWANPVGDVFAVGRNGVVLRRSGGTWSPMASPSSQHLLGLWGAGDSDLYVTTLEGGFYHWNGSSWTSIPTGQAFITDVWGSSANDVHVAGFGRMLHYDGVNLSSEDFAEHFMLRMSGAGSSSIFAAGENGMIAHFDGAAWSTQPNPLQPANPTRRIGEYNGIAAHGGSTYLIWCGNTLTANAARDQQAIVDRFEASEVTGVSLYDPSYPVAAAELEAPSPNPSRTGFSVAYSLPRPVRVELALFDLAGRRARTLLRGDQPAGRHVVGSDAATLAPGVYSLRLRAGNETLTQKMTVIR